MLLLAALVADRMPPSELPRRAGALLAAGALATAAWGGAAALASDSATLRGTVKFLLEYPAPNWFSMFEAAPAFCLLAMIGVVVAVDRAVRSDGDAAWLALIAAALGPAFLSSLLYRKFEVRYQYHALPFLVLLALLAAHAVCRRLLPARAAMAAALVVAGIAVRPDQSVAAVVRGYGPAREPFADEKVAPDHAGAGRFVKDRAGPTDFIAAEDMLQQQYYIGRVDAWLRRSEDARSFVRRDPAGGPPRDIYTGSVQVEEIDDLRAVADARGKRVIWLVTSGESEALPHWFRTQSTDATLRSWRPLAWHAGRDGMSWVFKLVDGTPVPPPGRPAP
jgi:hypothetical protein